MKKQGKYCFFFALLSILGLFLAKGSAPPLGNVNLWLFQNIPLAVAFRTQFERFGLVIVLGFSFLIGMTISELWSHLGSIHFAFPTKTKLPAYSLKKSAAKKTVVVTLILLVLTVCFVIYNYPFWNGDVIYPGSSYLPSARIQVPSYYTTVGNYISRQSGDFRVMDIPPRLTGTSAYIWAHGYAASDPIDEYYIHKPLIGVGYFSDLETQLFNMLYSTEVPVTFAKTLASMNCKYLLVHNDFNYTLEQDPGSNDTFAGFYLEKTFGQLELYRNEYWQPLQFYSTSNAVLLQSGFGDMFQIEGNQNYVINNDISVLSDQLSSNQLASLPSTIVSDNAINVSMQVLDGWVNTVDWASINSSSSSWVARYYSSWEKIISTSGTGRPNEIVFSSLNDCPYAKSLDKSGGWSGYDSTFIYLATGNNPLTINSITTNGQSVSDINVFWQTGTTRNYPIEIPPDQNVIIQINHKVNTAINLLMPNSSFTIPSAATEAAITYQEINPTKYTVSVNASQPYFLVFSESYDSGWVATINGQQVPSQYHFTANGYANGWYINKTGTYTVTLQFTPQNLFYIGAAISITTLLIITTVYTITTIKKRKFAETPKDKTQN